ncbi:MULTISPECIES: FAD-binding and (Fe-S)-binding domain-containing protein [Streptomyces]|uniref:Anaerobic glycerol-3-phosphate dehydrogenase subunit C n=1 Tax=Streptomyces chartreusis NRRL 3882 TaxID=1079985 RepID=A0A2N9B3Z9_STRCX|nr:MULTISPECIES: FAD-binding and (Fe-S)-binding domain-containing protein [Streptomyces]MYS88880.1 FAD-binding protein [Streptomyces sp. SID5464]SOR78060.1 Anaerobic glycerol-3-phosphate dehydrogenase subunit C [Streptomyces chartreusis NRRL 3882]
MTRTPFDASGADDVAGLAEALSEEVDAEVRFDAGSRGAYATDGSNYRQVPIGVVVPRTVEAGAHAVQVCARFGAPVLSRGGGTSLAGQSTNTAVVIDWSKYCNRLVSVDPAARTCVVEPGIVLDALNQRLFDHRLQFGPKPSTHSHCALGGMIGNNSCGASAQAYGKTVDNVRRLEVLTYDGVRMWVGPTSRAERARIAAEGGRRAELYAGLDGIVSGYLGDIRRGYPKIPRRVSGYNLDSLLPENGFDVARALVGSEGTLVTVLRAELDLVPVPAYQSLLVLGYDDICTAADDVPRLLEHCAPGQLEALDGRMAQLMREEGAYLESLNTLPEGESWLMLQFFGDSQDAVDEQAHALLGAVGRSEKDRTVAFSDDLEREQRMLKAREAGLGVTARPPDDRETWEGWEDSAVPPERLGDYLRDLQQLFEEFDYDHPSLYGHFGQGCVHTRIPFALTTAEGVADFRRFVERAADLVSSYGGSLSGEHGDGQSRGELLTRMFGERLVTAFGELKALFDPGNRMNPGKVVDPNPVDGQLRLGPSWHPATPATHFGFPEDDHSFDRAVMRCVGIGNCRSHSGGVMCPSYRATREEEHSTRGRARLLFEMLGGHADSAVTDGWRSTEVRDALDLCLACKGCKSDCPTGVDMATLKAEFLSHHYEGRMRPAAHYSMGWLPVWARLSRIAPGVVNSALHAPGLARAGKRLAGVDAARQAPVFARQSFLQWWQRRDTEEPDPADPRTVLLWPDTFSTYFHPSVAISAVHVLEDAGFRVAVPAKPVCCGLTWISTGQLPRAQKVLRRTLDVLRPHLEAGTPVIGLEPSCTAVFRADAPELMPGDQDVQRLAGQVRTFAEQLVRHAPDGWQPPGLARRATVQTHCHQHAIMKFDADRELMRRARLDADVLDEGCCGLAGNFGFERGHHEVSMAVAEQGVLPAVRAAEPGSLLLADGFSCRTQIEQGGTGRRALHLAEVLARGLEGTLPAGQPERLAVRPERPSRAARWTATAGATALTATAATVAGRAALRSLRRP